VINERLAKHYGIEGVKGDEFRRVMITPENHRGGVLGMAGLMTYLADGTPHTTDASGQLGAARVVQRPAQ